MKLFYFLAVLLLPLTAVSQTLKGIVSDRSGKPLPGITVTLKGTNYRTASDSQGQFELQVPASARSRVVLFTATHTVPLEIDFKEKRYLEVVLSYRDNSLDEVQIVAYGTNTQRFNVGSVTKVSAEDISRQPVANPLAALQGRVPGLTVSATSGLPGASFNVQVRGQNTLKTDQALVTPRDNPLFIVDGVPFATQNGNVNQFPSIASPGIGGVFNNAYGGFSPFNSINPSDIESIEVLRDADATAIYGSRGGNGVILITTKKGKAGKTRLDLSLRSGVSMVGNTMPMMDTRQYLTMRREALKNGGLTPNMTLNNNGYAPDLLVFDTTRYTDWKDVFLGNTATTNNVDLSLSGGNAGTQFRIGAAYNRDTYVFPGDFADNRGSLSFNIHHVSDNQRLTVDFSGSYSYDKNNSSGSPNLLAAYTLEPNYPDLLDAQGDLVWDYKGVTLGSSGVAVNPFSYLKTRYFIQNKNLIGNMQLAYRIAEGLSLKSSMGYNTFYSQEYYANPKSAQNPSRNPVASARFGNNDYETWIIEPQLEYRKTIGESDLAILIGSTFQRNNNLKREANGTGYINDDLMGSVSGAQTRTATDASGTYKYAAVFSRISYRLRDRYILSLNARRDGSSRFGPDKQFGNFGSVGAGWLFNEEQFVKDGIPFLSYGKLHASYGLTGSDAIADYQYFARWSPSAYTYQGSVGYLPQNLFNAEFSWATTKKLELGLELGFLQDRLLLSSTFYRNRSGNQLIMYNLPATAGFSTVVENWDATVQNKGLEVMLKAALVKGRKVSWNTAFNITLPENKLLSFPDLATSSYSTSYVVGQSLNTVYGYKLAGVNETTGIFQFFDANGDLTNTPKAPSLGQFNDYYTIGNLDPKFFGGLQNDLSYKNVQLGFFFEFKKQTGLTYLSQVYAYLPGMERNLPAQLTDRWQQPGDVTDIQRFSAQYLGEYTGRTSFLRSDGVYGDASYIRLKTLSLSYNLSGKMLKKIGASGLRIYSNAQNLFTLTNYKGNDPETQNFYGMPPLRTIVFGFNLSL